MRFYRNKKSLVKSFLVGILITTAGFLLIVGISHVFINKANASTADKVCKASIALKEASYREIKAGPIKFGSVATPRLCRTIEFDLPEDKSATKEDIKKQFADLMASCWDRYGEGLIEDVFKEGDTSQKNCEVCYAINLRETSKFKDQDQIGLNDFLQYLYETPYKVSSESDDCKVSGGYCIDSDDIDDCAVQLDVDSSYALVDKKSTVCRKQGKSCCYTDYECWNRGKICSSENPDESKYRQYDGWECPPKMNCFVENEDYYTYGEYIQRFGGKGNIIITAPIIPGETYAISFGSPTGECGFCTWIGVGAAVVGAVAFTVATGGAGIAFVGPVLGATLAGGVGFGLGKGLSEVIVSGLNLDDLFRRDTNTIYLTTLNQIRQGDYCNIIEG